MKKVCPGCGRNRRLDKKYNNNKSKPDGKQIYCQDCQRDRNKRDSKRVRDRILKRKRDKRWKQQNGDYMREYNAMYYEKNKERIMSRRNTESILIIENPSKKKINRNRPKKQKSTYEIEINPQRRK